MSHDKPHTDVFWKRSKKLNNNIRQLEQSHLSLLPAATRVCDLPKGLIVSGSKYEITFRYHAQQYHHYQIGVSTTLNESNGQRTIWQYTGRLANIDQLKWFNRTVEELIPMALRLYS